MSPCNSYSQDSIRELTRVRTELEQQLENANTQKYESERQVSQTMARVDTLLQEKTKMEESNSSLEEAMHSLRYSLTCTLWLGCIFR